MGNMLKSEVFLEQRRLQPQGAIDEKHGIGDIMFLLESLRKLFCQDNSSCRKQPHMQELVRFGVDGGVQPESLIVELNHGFINRNVIWTLAVVKL